VVRPSGTPVVRAQGTPLFRPPLYPLLIQAGTSRCSPSEFTIHHSAFFLTPDTCSWPSSLQPNPVEAVPPRHIGEDNFVTGFQSFHNLNGADRGAAQRDGDAHGFLATIRELKEGDLAARLPHRRAADIEHIAQPLDGDCPSTLRSGTAPGGSESSSFTSTVRVPLSTDGSIRTTCPAISPLWVSMLAFWPSCISFAWVSAILSCALRCAGWATLARMVPAATRCPPLRALPAARLPPRPARGGNQAGCALGCKAREAVRFWPAGQQAAPLWSRRAPSLARFQSGCAWRRRRPWRPKASDSVQTEARASPAPRPSQRSDGLVDNPTVPWRP